MELLASGCWMLSILLRQRSDCTNSRKETLKLWNIMKLLLAKEVKNLWRWRAHMKEVLQRACPASAFFLRHPPFVTEGERILGQIHLISHSTAALTQLTQTRHRFTCISKLLTLLPAVSASHCTAPGDAAKSHGVMVNHLTPSTYQKGLLSRHGVLHSPPFP